MLPNKACDAFLAVAEYGNFEIAANKLNITASAVTLRVQALEKQLGQILILRERPCRTTKAGQMLLEHLQHQRLKEELLLEQLQGKNNLNQFHKLKIASNADSLATWLLPALQNTLIQQQYTLRLTVDDQSQTHQLIEHGQVNACISSEAHSIAGCVSHTLGSMTYSLVATPEFQQQWFAQGINREALHHAPAVIFNHKDLLHEEIICSLFGLNMQQYPYHLIPSSHTFIDAIELGLGFGMAPILQVQAQLKSGSLIKLTPEADTEVSLYWHHWKQQSQALQTLTSVIIQEALNRLNQQH